jgi:hypothetical protein
LRLIWSALIGCIGGFCGNAVLGILFSIPLTRDVLYDPSWQSQLFIQITPLRNIPLSVSGLIVLSAVHGVLYSLIQPTLANHSSVKNGVLLGILIWATYWLFQEWFIYITLLHEPVLLASFELALLLCGSIVEGLVIALLNDKYRLLGPKRAT